MRYNVLVSNLAYLSWFGHNSTLKLLLRWCVKNQLHERMHIYNDIDVCSRYAIFAGIDDYLLLPFVSFFWVVWNSLLIAIVDMMCTTNNISGWCALDLRHQRILVLPWHHYHPPVPTIDKNNIIYDVCNVLDVMWDWRYGMIFGLDCNTKIVDE